GPGGVLLLAINAGEETMAIFTDTAAPGAAGAPVSRQPTADLGIVKICKVAGPGVALGTPYTFTATATPPGGSPITSPITVPAGPPAQGGYCEPSPGFTTIAPRLLQPQFLPAASAGTGQEAPTPPGHN